MTTSSQDFINDNAQDAQTEESIAPEFENVRQDAAEAASTQEDVVVEASAEDATVESSEQADLQETCDRLADELQEWKDRYLRLQAEWDTYRRRMNEQRQEEKILAAEKILNSLIPVLDDFDRSIEYAHKSGSQDLLAGVEAVQTKFIQVLEADGLEQIHPQGEAYDSLEAQAVGVVDDTSVPHETVLEVFQKGYRLGTKVLRPAMVSVSQGGEMRSQECGDSDDK